MRQKHTHGERDTLGDTQRDIVRVTQRHTHRDTHTERDTHTLRAMHTERKTNTH